MKTTCRALLTALAAAATLCGQHPALAAAPSSWVPAHGARDHDRDGDRNRDQGRNRDHDRDGDRNRDRDRDHDRDHGRDHDRDGDHNRDGDHERDWRDHDRDWRDHDRDWRADRREDWRRVEPVRVEPVRIVRYGYPYYGRPYWYGGRYFYRGYYGDGWGNDYGVVRSGRCNTDVLLGVTGAVTGAVIGNRSASPDNQGMATIFGAIAGGIIGSAVGSAIDNGDRACIGQSLELAPIGHPVYWVNPRSRVHWRMVPMRDVSPVCREFQVYREFGGYRGDQRVIACRRYRGAWDVRG